MLAWLLLLGMPLAAPSQDPACVTSANAASLARRASPLDSVAISVGRGTLKVCYGRPSLRGRTMLGSERIPFGRIWRTGANEPTMLHLTVDAQVAGVTLSPGTYSLYTIPGASTWEIILNRSIAQWGDEGSYTEEIQKQEVGRGTVAVARTTTPIETFTIRTEPGALILEWETTRLTIPVTPVR